MTKRRIAFTLGALVLIVGVVTGRERPALELLQESAPRAAPRDDGIDLGRLQRDAAGAPQVDPFGRKETQKTATPAAKPEAPALPFQYFGKLIENGKLEVYVLRGEEVHAVAAGMRIADYRVDKVTESAVSFTYLPLKTRQTLDLQAVN